METQKIPNELRKLIAWAKAEIKEYEKFIEMLEKKINPRRK